MTIVETKLANNELTTIIHKFDRMMQLLQENDFTMNLEFTYAKRVM